MWRDTAGRWLGLAHTGHQPLPEDGQGGLKLPADAIMLHRFASMSVSASIVDCSGCLPEAEAGAPMRRSNPRYSSQG